MQDTMLSSLNVIPRRAGDEVCRSEPLAFRWWRMVFVAVVFQSLSLSGARADGEPVVEFLNQLRAAKYFDTAIIYIDRLDQVPGVSEDTLKARDLERAQTYIDAAFASRSTKARDGFFADAEASLKDFLNKGKHPRQSEARLRLGKIQMVRAAELMSGEPDSQKRSQARKSYQAAAQTFEQIVEALRAELKKVRGAKVDARKDPEKAALRDRYRGEFLEAMANSGEANSYAAKTFPDPAKQAKPQLEKALKTFTELSEKYGNYVQGAIGLVRRGQLQEQLGKTDAALESYTKMLETIDVPELRDSKFQATAGLIRLAIAKSPPDYKDAINRGEATLKGLRPSEKQSPGVAELQFDLAKAFLAKSKDEKNLKNNERKRAETEGRKLLVAASKIGGEHLVETKGLLEKFGVELDKAAAGLPDDAPPANFQEGLTRAQQAYAASLKLAESLNRGTKKEAADELEKQLYQVRFSGIQLLRSSLGLVNNESDSALVNTARQLLAVLLNQSERHREAAVVGSFLARNAPGTDAGLDGGLVSLISLQTLLQATPDDEVLVSSLSSLGEYLGKTWPDDPRASSAKQVRVQLAFKAGQWSQARTLIDQMKDPVAQAKSRRILGQLLWAETIRALQKDDQPTAEKLMSQAGKDLQQGLAPVKSEQADEKVLRAALVLAKVQLRSDQATQAAQTLKHPNYGPASLQKKVGVKDASFLSELHTTQLQVIVQQMTGDGAPMDRLLGQASDTMEELRRSVRGSESEKQKRLTGIYLGLANDIKSQLDTATPGKKVKLASAFRVLLEKVSQTTQDNPTLLWIAQTLMQLGESTLPPGGRKAKGVSAELLSTAIATMDRLTGEAKESPSSRFQRARALRMTGEYGKAIGAYEALLKQKPTMIDAQVEAATAYEQWAALLPPKHAPTAYERAYRGAKPNAKKENVIWGWGKISRITNGKEQFRDIFFDARYHLAQCRFLRGKSRKSTPEMKKAISDIGLVAALYPEFGSPAQKKKFDTLIRRIQKEVGDPVEGLKVFK